MYSDSENDDFHNSNSLTVPNAAEVINNDILHPNQWDQPKEIINFNEMEQLLLKKYQSILTCRTCSRNNCLSSAGKAGTKTKMGTQRLQVKCRYCGTVKESLHKCLARHQECYNDCETLRRQYERVQRQGKYDDTGTRDSIGYQPYRNDLNGVSGSIKQHFQTRRECGEEVQDVEDMILSNEELENNRRKRCREDDRVNDEDIESDIEHSEGALTTFKNGEAVLRKEMRELREMMEEVKRVNKRLQEDNERLTRDNKKSREALDILREEVKGLRRQEVNKSENSSNSENKEFPLQDPLLRVGEGQEPTEVEDPNEGMEDNQHPTRTFAEAVRKGAKRGNLKKVKEMQAALKFIHMPAAPQTFTKIFMYWNPGRHIKSQGRKEVLHYAYRLLEALKIRRKVKEISLIGNSLIELYVAGVCLDEVKQQLTDNKVKFTFNLDRTNNIFTGVNNSIDNTDKTDKIINRVGYLINRHHIKNLRECMLEGFSQDIRNSILIKEEEIKRKWLQTRTTPPNRTNSNSTYTNKEEVNTSGNNNRSPPNTTPVVSSNNDKLGEVYNNNTPSPDIDTWNTGDYDGQL